MNTSIHLNGDARERAATGVATGASDHGAPVGRPSAPRRASGRPWIAMILGLLSLNATIVGTTVYLALSDSTSAIEPDYYARALHYDDVIQQRAASAKLGWKADASFRVAPGGRSMELAVTLKDREGRPVEHADVRAVAFASVRASERQSLALRELAPGGGSTEAAHAAAGANQAGEPGVYAAPLRIGATGAWRITITAQRMSETFVSQTDLFVPADPS